MSLDELIEEYDFESVVPGICKHCGKSQFVEPDCSDGVCSECGSAGVNSFYDYFRGDMIVHTDASYSGPLLVIGYVVAENGKITDRHAVISDNLKDGEGQAVKLALQKYPKEVIHCDEIGACKRLGVNKIRSSDNLAHGLVHSRVREVTLLKAKTKRIESPLAEALHKRSNQANHLKNLIKNFNVGVKNLYDTTILHRT